METHRLYMLNPWQDPDGQGPFYCPDCGVVEGFLAYSPEVRGKIEIITHLEPAEDHDGTGENIPIIILNKG